MKPYQKLKEVRGIFGSRFMAPMPDPHIGGVIEREFVRELQLTAAILAACQGKKLFVDVGANIGWHTVLVGIKNPRMKIDAWEPHPETFGILRENMRLNGGMENVSPIMVGASDVVDTVRMYEHPESLGGSQITPRADWKDAPSVDIELGRLDSKYQQVDVMKMEVQGFEVKALRGLSGCKVDKLFISYAPRMIEAAGDSPDEFRRILADKFMSVRQISAKFGLVEKPVKWADLDRDAARGDVAVFFDFVCEAGY